MKGKRHAKVSFRDLRSGKQIELKDAVEIAPGVFAGAIPPEHLPKVGICGYLRRADGLLVTVARVQGTTVKLTRDIGQRLGLAVEGDGDIYHTVRRLITAGFIKAAPMTPSGAWRIDVESFWSLWQQMMSEGSKFWTEKRAKRMREARYEALQTPEEEE